jgi:Protein of unknown function (DUF2905)
MLGGMGRRLMWLGVELFLAGLLMHLLGKLPWAGRLPGDLVVRRGNLTFYSPLGAMIILSLVLTVALNLIIRLRR